MRASVKELRAALAKAFDCCGGNDDTPQEHTTDCNRMEVQNCTGWQHLENELTKARESFWLMRSKYEAVEQTLEARVNELATVRLNAQRLAKYHLWAVGDWRLVDAEEPESQADINKLARSLLKEGV